MTINEFMMFVSLVCNLESPTSQVPRHVKTDCVEYYTNCAIKGDGSKIDRLTVSNCTIKSKDASRKWGI